MLRRLPVWQVALSALVLVGVTVLVVAFRHKKYLPVGWFWFLGTLIPASDWCRWVMPQWRIVMRTYR